jgi:hypothetical protein
MFVNENNNNNDGLTIRDFEIHIDQINVDRKITLKEIPELRNKKVKKFELRKTKGKLVVWQ